MDKEGKKSVPDGMYTQGNPGNFHRKLTVDLAVAGGGMAGTAAAIAKAETLLCQQRSVCSRLWFFQWSCMDVRVGL